VSDFRKRVLDPALLPLAAFVFIGAFVFAFSRILLAVPKDGSVIVGVVMAACILFAAGAVSKGGKIKAAQRTGLIAFALVLIAGGVTAGAALGVRPVEKHLQADVKFATASHGSDFAFESKELAIPAGKLFGLEFDNKDAGTTHNIDIYTKAGGTSLFKGDFVTGPATRLYGVKAIPAGVYYFQCDVHPFMNGTVRAGAGKPGPAGGPPGGPSPGPSASAPAPQPSPSGTVIALTAKNTMFDKDGLQFQANKQVTIDFHNEDVSGIPHNFSLYSDEAHTKNIFRGDPPVTAPATGEYTFKAPGPGTYYFQCDYHPQQMHGTVTVS